MSENSLLTLITNPRAFFEALEAQPVKLLVPGLFVLVTALVSAISAYQISGLVSQMMPELRSMGPLLGGIGAISTLVIVLLMWVIYTAVFFAISMAFKGQGDFGRLLSYVGYGYLPQAIGSIVGLVLTWNLLSNLRVPSITDPTMIAEWTQSLMKDPTMQLATAVGLLFLLWSANIWIFGVRSGRKVSFRDAAITVGVPVLLYVLYTVYTMVS